MKKIIALLLAALLCFSFAGCNNTPADDNGDVENNENPKEPLAANAEEFLKNALDAFANNLVDSFGMPAEEIKMAFPGGYYDENDETTMTQGPGKVPVTDPSVLSTMLLPEANVSMVETTAVFFHPMMINFFVGSAFQVSDAANVDTVASALNNAISNNQWVCGQPEGYAIIKADTFIVSVYGLNDNVTALKDAITSTYEEATVAFEGSFVSEGDGFVDEF